MFCVLYWERVSCVLCIFQKFLQSFYRTNASKTQNDQPLNESVCKKLESIQYKVALAITGAIQGTSRKKIYQELRLESLRARRWYKRLSCMFKIVKEEAPNYLINLIPKIQQNTRTRIKRLPTFHFCTDCFKNSFFPSTLNDW